MTDPQPKLGRLYSPDERDRNFLLSFSREARQTAENIPYRYHSLPKPRFRNQGTTSACTGAAARHWLDAGPVKNLSGPDWWDLSNVP